MTHNITLLQPAWLWLLPLLALVAWLWRKLATVRDDRGIAAVTPNADMVFLHPLISLLPAQLAGAERSRIFYRIVIWLSLTCLVVALCNPVRIGALLPDPPERRDIVLIVDTSVSMLLRDYVFNGQRIERITVLKALLDRFVTQLRGARVAIIVFAEKAHTLLPLTNDTPLVQRMIARIKTGMAGRYNAVGEAVALGVREAGAQPQRRRILVLFTVGAEPTGDIAAEAAAELAAQAGLPLYTVGIGATEYAAEEKRQTGLIYEPVDIELLRLLSAATGAHGFLASDAHALQQALVEINGRETRAAPVPTRRRQEPLYYWPLLAGLLLLSFGQGLRLFGKRQA